MNVFYTKTYNLSGKNAEKQNNIATVAKKMGFEEISFFKFEDQSDSDRELNVRMDGILAAVEENAVVIFQYPSMVSSRYDRCAIEHIRQSKDRKLILMVQDLGGAVDPKDYPMLADEIELFQQADLLILQSVKMKDFLVEHGLGEVPVVYQRVWEYPYEIYNNEVQVEKRLQTIEDISIPALLDLQTGGVAVLEKKDDFYEDPQELEEEPLEPELKLSKQEQRWIVFGALKSALLIGSVYLVGAALLIWFLLKIWT